MWLIWTAVLLQSEVKSDLEYLHQVAHEVIDSAKVAPGATIPNGGRNTTGHTLRVPGGTQTYYPAFWVRDAAMMLGADLVPGDEIDGWIKVVAQTQPGPEGLHFDHDLVVPPYSIPDHITLDGRACWYPGAYAEQGVGDYGHLPPADDAFYFIQMAYEAWKLKPTRGQVLQRVKTGWGEHPLIEVCEKAFESVDADPGTGCVVCSSDPLKTRVDWGFCDSIRKKGQCLMPSLLRWQAAERMAEMLKFLRRGIDAKRYIDLGKRIASGCGQFEFDFVGRMGLRSAQELGRGEDVWAQAFALSLGFLPKMEGERIALHVGERYAGKGTVVDGQVRHLPIGEYWEEASSGKGTYQNGGYWATPTGWYVAALKPSSPMLAERLLHDYVRYLKLNRGNGAPFEWINPSIGEARNPNYGSSVGLVYIAAAKAYGS